FFRHDRTACQFFIGARLGVHGQAQSTRGENLEPGFFQVLPHGIPVLLVGVVRLRGLVQSLGLESEDRLLSLHGDVAHNLVGKGVVRWCDGGQSKLHNGDSFANYVVCKERGLNRRMERTVSFSSTGIGNSSVSVPVNPGSSLPRAWSSAP